MRARNIFCYEMTVFSNFLIYFGILLINLGSTRVSSFSILNANFDDVPAYLPVILVPGDGGSQVEAKLNKTTVVHYLCEKSSDYFNIWLNLELLVPVVIDCWIDNMRLIYNNETRTTSSPEGVEIRIPGFGNSTTVEWLDPSQASQGSYFSNIAKSLTAEGFVRNVSLRGAPYDFRKTPVENGNYFVQLKALVEETYRINGNRQVVLLAHSMGGPMCLYLLQTQSQSWKDKYIRALVTLSSPWGGSIKAIKVFAVGDDLGSYALRESVMKQEQITSPSLSWMLPSNLLWKNSEILVQTDSKNYTVQNLADYFNDIDYPVGWEMRKDIEKIATDFTAPGVEVYCMYGSGLPTVERLVYAKGKFPNGYPSFVYGDGDGTVNRRSLEACTYWQGRQKKKVYSHIFPNAEHLNILRDNNIAAYVAELLKKLS